MCDQPYYGQRSCTDQALEKTFGNPVDPVYTQTKLPKEWMGVMGSFLPQRSQTDIRLKKEFGKPVMYPISIGTISPEGVTGNMRPERSETDIAMMNEFNPIKENYRPARTSDDPYNIYSYNAPFYPLR